MATYSSILDWKIPRTEESGRLPSQSHKESDTTEGTLHAHMHLMVWNRQCFGPDSNISAVLSSLIGSSVSYPVQYCNDPRQTVELSSITLTEPNFCHSALEFSVCTLGENKTTPSPKWERQKVTTDKKQNKHFHLGIINLCLEKTNKHFFASFDFYSFHNDS